MWTQSAEAAAKYPQLNYIPSKPGEGIGSRFVYTGGGHSGYQAVNLALQWGAEEVILCGYTMAATGGQKHWHPDHKGNNPELSQLQRWSEVLDGMARFTDKIRAHGDTSLNFPQVSLVPKCRGVIAVARSGGWVTPEYAHRLYDATGAVILTDMTLDCPSVPLQHDWPGWWAKMEIFSGRFTGDWLYIDMDTIVTGDISPLLEVGHLALLGDFYRPTLEAGVMYLPEWARKIVWARWIDNPDAIMAEHRGDGDFIRESIGHWAKDLRALVDGLHSYKVDGIKDDTRLLIYHGSPRPHETCHW